MIISKLANHICPTWETLFPSEKAVVAWGLKNCPELILDFLEKEDDK